MPKATVVFFKHYTRDTSLIIQQFWLYSLSEGVKDLGINIKKPIGVDFINKGVIEIWENRMAASEIKAGLARFCKEEPQQALALLRRYKLGLKSLQPIWRRGYLADIPSFKKYLAQVKTLVLGDLFISFVGPDAKITGRAKEIAVRLRREDHFFASNSRVMIKTIKKLFPKLRDYANVLRYEDLDNPPSLAECRRRVNGFVCAPDGYSRVQSLEGYARVKGYQLAKDEARKIKGGLAGLTASSGKAEGRAKIVFSARELNKVKKGDIIISPMTTADMFPALKKARAIVTDEGGLICHAAIIAREFKKPCLIATRIATKFFKDNDQVEVDAGAGWVKKIK